MKKLILVAVIGCANWASPVFAACENQVQSAASNYLIRNLNDNHAGNVIIESVEEIVAPSGGIRNGFAEVKAIYHKRNVTSVHDLVGIKLEVIYSPRCEIVSVNPAQVASTPSPAERGRFTTLTGTFVRDSNCAETGFGLRLKSGQNICVGFHSSDLTDRDLVLGQEYSLGGYMTADGFFITEFAN